MHALAHSPGSGIDNRLFVPIPEARHAVIAAFVQGMGRQPSRVERAHLLSWPKERLFKGKAEFAANEFGADSLSHAAAHDIIVKAFTLDRGRAPTAAEAEAAQSVAHHETGYGRYWKAPGTNSHNWGAVQTRGPGFSYTDSSPDSGTYKVNFKIYPDDVAGARDFIHMLYNDPFTYLKGEGLAGFARGMYGNHYFEGFNANPSQVTKWAPVIKAIEKAGGLTAIKAGRVAGYAVALDQSARDIAAARGVKRSTALLGAAGGIGGQHPALLLAEVGVGAYMGYRLIELAARRLL